MGTHVHVHMSLGVTTDLLTRTQLPEEFLICLSGGPKSIPQSSVLLHVTMSPVESGEHQ